MHVNRCVQKHDNFACIELTGGQYKNACKTLEDLATSLGRIHSQSTLKKVALLGGVEEAVKAIKEIIWHAINTFRKYTH